MQIFAVLSCVIVPYRAVSCDIGHRAKKLLYLCIANETKRQYPAVSCSIVQYRAISCNIVQFSASRKINVVPLHQKNVDGGST